MHDLLHLISFNTDTNLATGLYKKKFSVTLF